MEETNTPEVSDTEASESESMSFAELFEESRKGKTLKEGEIAKGKVIKVTKDFVVVDIQQKRSVKPEVTEM